MPKKRSNPPLSGRRDRVRRASPKATEQATRDAVDPASDRQLQTLVLRTMPVQRRAKATVGHILETAAVLLDEVGVDGFNTNRLAERAGVRVRTVYRYFPNKVAVLSALSERVGTAEQSFLDAFSVVADPTVAWSEAVDSIIDGYIRGTRNVAGLTPIRTAARAMPELRAVEDRFKHVIADALADALRKRGVQLPRRRMEAMTRMLVETTTVTMDMARDGGRTYSDRFVSELKAMLSAYMSASFGQDPQA